MQVSGPTRAEEEQVADHVTMISHGNLTLSAPLAFIRDSYRWVPIRFPEPRSQPPMWAFFQKQRLPAKP